MTKKSIPTICLELEQQGKLVRFEPATMLANETETRRLYLSKSVAGFVSGTYQKKTDIDYYGNVRGFLKRFVIGADMVFDEDIKPLQPRDQRVWEMRIRMDPQARLFGAFAEYNCFVAFRAKFRDDCDKYQSGKKGFDQARDQVADDWIAHFPGHARLASYPLEYCISGAVQ